MTQHNLPQESLCLLPTPLHRLPNISQKLSTELWIKRDDLTGLSLGGNKLRKLQYIMGEAISQGADTIITSGASQSNHCCQTSAAAAKLGLECHLLLGGTAPEQVRGNLLLDGYFGAKVHFCGENRKGEDSAELVKTLTQQGKKPYLVPYGGSSELGALAFADALQEVKNEGFSHIVFASSSGGSHAGLLLGKAIAGIDCQLIGIGIDSNNRSDSEFPELVIDLAHRASALMGRSDRFETSDVLINSDYIGAGYGKISALEMDAIKLLACSEGILLDPVYTGRAFGGMVDLVNNNRLENPSKVLFWHTGGAPAIFA